MVRDREILLGVRELSKTYGGAPALDAVTAEFRAGQICALLGENGAGKSTLVKSVAGVVRPTSGSIYGTAYEQGDIAMVFQELSVVPELSVLDNLALAWRHRRGPLVSYRAIRRRASDCLRAAGLTDVDLTGPVEALSLAERQLLEIARGLIADAKVLILDEPTATLSDVEINRVHRVVRQLAARGTAIVYITHRLGEVFDIADRIIVMRAGRVVAEGATSEFDMRSVVTHMIGSDHTPVNKAATPVSRDRRARARLDGLRVGSRISNVSIDIDAGEIVALFGQIGSGAEDLVRAVAGVVPLSGGSVSIAGRKLRLGNRSTAQAGGVAYISPDRVHEGVLLSATVTTNITSGALKDVTRLGVLRRREETRLAESFSRQVALDARRVREPVSAFSGGNQQKVAIARALATKPRMLTLNEPTRGVDIGARAEIYRTIRSLAADGVIVCLYSSDVVEIRELADRVITVYRGRIVGQHHVESVTNADLLTEILHGTPA